jgi:hypothetical protein
MKRLIAEFEFSGLRQIQFCRNHGLALSKLAAAAEKTTSGSHVTSKSCPNLTVRNTRFEKQSSIYSSQMMKLNSFKSSAEAEHSGAGRKIAMTARLRHGARWAYTQCRLAKLTGQ